MDGISTDRFIRGLVGHSKGFFDCDVIINSCMVMIYTDRYKKFHKNRFYKDLYDELMTITWHPSRFADWCLDFEESKDYERALGD